MSLKNVILCACFNIFVLVIQFILLPITINSYRDRYIILMICLLLLTPIIFYHLRNNLMPSKNLLLRYSLLGLVNTVSMIITIYSYSSERAERAPIYFQSSLINLIVPLSFLFNRCLIKEKISTYQSYGVAIIFFGITVSFVPKIITLFHHNEYDIFNMYWYVIYLLGMIIYCFANVFQNYLLKNDPDIELSQLLSWTYLMQCLFTLFFFWINFVPVIGFNHSFNQWFSDFSLDWHTFLSPTVATIYILSYGIGYMGQFASTTYLIKLTSANIANTILSASFSISAVFLAVFFESKYSLTTYDIIFNLLSAMIILIGICTYFYNQEKTIVHGDFTIMDADIDELFREDIQDIYPQGNISPLYDVVI